ncbi:predicted protein [Paecilomyces variotii No. 5]|uniref:Uncharacterized protein n=1 Tax=Byssochlamys spectabilis (strain No. 5 / NBRC 109023) TaxID=1356009 RepID=V5FGA5_BYSSN|nr:predicted protein [Paecilomyces variotii No. 5]
MIAVATVVDIVIDNDSRTVGQFTIPTLSATVSDASPGSVTIASDLTAPITATSIPASPESAASASATPSGTSGNPGSLSPGASTSPSVTPTSSRHPTPSDHFFSHIPSSSRAIPSPSPSPSGSPSASPASAASTTSASASISTSGSISLTSTSTVQSVLSSLSSSESASSVSSTYAHSATSGSTNGSSTSAATTGAGGGVGGSASGSGNDGQSSSGDGSNSQGSGSGSGGVSTPRVVGGVVGGVAGAFFLLALALLVLRWRKKYAQKTRGVLPSDDGTSGAARSGSGPPNAEIMSQRSSVTPLAAAAASAGFFNRWRHSAQTVSTQDTTPSERGFQKISGRKIPSVLRTGGDGYGSGGEEEIVPGAAASSTDLFPRPGHLPTAPTIVETTAEGDEHSVQSDQYEPPLTATTTRASDMERDGVFIRPSPARSPMASSVNLPASGQSTPTTQQAIRATSIPRRPDLIGRSHPSWDGSRGSRFTESID